MDSLFTPKDCICGAGAPEIVFIPFKNGNKEGLGFSAVRCKKCRRSTGLYKDWDVPGDSNNDAVVAWNHDKIINEKGK